MGILTNGYCMRNHLNGMIFLSDIKKIHAIFFHIDMNQEEVNDSWNLNTNHFEFPFNENIKVMNEPFKPKGVMNIL